jgi:ankyrin repeat protein
VRADDLKTVVALLSAGADVNAANRYGVTPLSLAATNASAPMVQELLKAGAGARAALPNGQTVLMSAARTGNPEVAGMLIARGADVNAKESSLGETALMWAAAENHAGVLKVLIEHGADLNARSHTLAFPKDRFGLEGVTTVLPRGSWTALMYAARQGSLEAARTLADAGANLNAADPDGTTALVLAIVNGHYDTAALLVEKGADANLADTAGMAALYEAVDMNTLGEIYGRPFRKPASRLTALDLISMLLARGADPNARLKTPTLFRAHTPGEGSFGEGTTPLMRAARNGDIPAMQVLLDHGADPALAQKNGTTALMLAAGLGRGQGAFAKDYATEAELLAAVRWLVEHGVDVNAAGDNGQTALHYAAQASDGIVQYLAGHGADLQAKDKQGRTPLDVALGVGVRQRIGGEPTVRESTAALLRQLIASRP